MSTTELAEQIGISRRAVAKHVAVLQSFGAKGELEEVVTNCDNPDRLTMKRRSDQMASRVEHVERVEGRGFVDGNNFDN